MNRERKERKMKRIFVIVFALALALGLALVASTPAAADPGTTYYVSTTGSDVTGTGAWDNPWATIQHAVDQVSSGDTIEVASGTYAGAVVDKDVTISGSASGTSTIDTGVCYNSGCSPAYKTAFRLDAGADGAEIGDFTIDCDVNTSFYFGIFARAVDDVTIDSLEINETVQGISNWGGSSWTITNNIITDTVAAGGGGIGILLGARAATSGYGVCRDNLVQYNTIDASASAEDYSCPAIALSLDLRYGGYLAVNGSEDISGNQILDNTITASAANNLVGIEVGTILGDSETDPVRDDPDEIAAVMAAGAVHDNTVQGNSVDGADTGIYFYNVTDLTVDENTVENSVSYGIYGEHGQSGTAITGNTFSANEIQLADETDDTETLDSLDIESILADNTFDRAVTVDHPGSSLLHTIWSNIQDGVDAASAGDTVNVAAGTYALEEQVLIDKDLAIIGEDKETTTIEPGSEFSSSYLFRINDGEVGLSSLTLDGKNDLYGGVRFTAPGTGTVEDCIFKDITDGAYLGFGLVVYGDDVTVSDNAFSNIGRVGIWVGGDDVLVTGNTYTGKGAIDCLDYGIEVGFGGTATITDNTIANCRGVASSDGSTSAAILVTTYYGAGTAATITGNVLTGNTGGIAVGYDGSDTSTVSAHYNDISGNTDYGIDTTAPSVDANANWWGDASGPYNATTNPSGTGNAVSDNVDYSPWWGANYIGVVHPWEWYTNDSIQEAIDLASDGDTIKVYPGTYDQDEANDRDPVNGGAGSTDFNIFVDKSVTIQGVDEDGNPITDADNVEAFVIPKRDTPLGNLSTIFIQADGVVITGLDVTAYDDENYNFKTISVIGDNASIKYCALHARDQVSSIYMYDPRYVSANDTSYIQSYTFEDNYLDAGGLYASGIRISSGPGWSGDVADRIISGNTFDWGSYGIEFVGPGGDPWDYYPVGAAIITDNGFTGQDKGSVVAWGKYKDAVGYGDIDWDGIFSGNTFDKAVMVKTPGGAVRYYDYTSGPPNFYYVRGIYSAIQRYPIDRVAQAGDTVNVAAGTYDEQLTIDKSLILNGAGQDLTFLKAAGAPVVTVTADNVTIQDLEITDTPYLIEGIRIASGASTGLTVDCVDFTELGAGTGANAYGIYIANSFANLSVTDCDFVPVTHTTNYRTIGVFAPNLLNLSNFEVGGSTFQGIWTGIYLRSAIDGLVVTGSTFGQVQSSDFTACVSGIYIGDGSDYSFDIENVVVSGNTFTEYGRGVYLWNYANNGTVSNFEIYGNTFTNSVWSSGIRLIAGIGEDEGVSLDGINVHDNVFTQNSTVGTHVALVDFRAYCELAACDIAVADNEITLTGGPYTAPWSGIAFLAYNGPFTNTVVDGNTLSGGNCGGAGTPPSTGVLLKHESSTYWPSGILQMDITHNEITGFDHGVGIYDNVAAQYGGLPTGCDVDINYNQIHGNALYGVINGNSEIVDATYNWWGYASGPYHAVLNPVGEGNAVSDNVLFEPWFVDEDMTTLVAHSTYVFDYEVPDVIVALDEIVVPVTFETDVLGDIGYVGVRFKFSATGPGDVIFKATDSEEHEYTFVNEGYWGPPAGFYLAAEYSASTDWSLNFSEPGEYTITFALIEAPDGEVIAGIEGSEIVTVRAVDIFDYYRRLHGAYDVVDTLDLLAAADDWIADEVPPGFDQPITTMQLLALADEWFAS
jgi:parallel beta-helix repeat protein